jgi:hypothetical protein
MSELSSYHSAVDGVSVHLEVARHLRWSSEREIGEPKEIPDEWDIAIDRARFWLKRMPKYHANDILIHLHSIKWPSFKDLKPSAKQLLLLECLWRVATIWQSPCVGRCQVVPGDEEKTTVHVCVSVQVESVQIKALKELNLLEAYRSFTVISRIVSYFSPGIILEREHHIDLLAAETCFDLHPHRSINEEFHVEVYHPLGLRAICRPGSK